MSRLSLSVALTTYNHGRYLPGALDAILSQDRPADELIVLDDGSSDDTPAILAAYAKRCGYLRCERNPAPSGAMNATRQVLDMTTCDFVYSAAADDRVLPHAFSRAMEVAEAYPEAGLVFGSIALMDPAERYLGQMKPGAWTRPCFVSPARFLTEYLDREGAFASFCGSTYLRREAMNAAGSYRPELGLYADTFLARSLGLRHGVGYVPHDLMAWTLLPDSLSHSAARDPYGLLDVAARVTWLARSPEFASDWPEDHVRRWEERFRATVIGTHRERVAGALRILSALVEREPSAQAQSLLEPLAAEREAILEEAVRQLEAYAGDTSCYD